jgi:alkylation response protein AidB-like acyl-CoA dehydrogenase
VIDDDEYARRLATVKAEITVLRSLAYQSISRNRRTGMPGPEGSMLRLSFGTHLQEVFRLAIDVLGHDALRFVDRFQRNGWTGRWLRSFAAGIGAGTFEIQRNIIGERVLGLPRDRN